MTLFRRDGSECVWAFFISSESFTRWMALLFSFMYACEWGPDGGLYRPVCPRWLAPASSPLPVEKSVSVSSAAASASL